MRRVAVLALLLLVVAAVGCGGDDDDDDGARGAPTVTVPARAADRAGTITSKDGSAILVEEFPDAETGDKISAAITDTTVIVREGADGTRTTATFEDLVVGQQVQLWVDGAIAESYPEQGGASVVLIVS